MVLRKGKKKLSAIFHAMRIAGRKPSNSGEISESTAGASSEMDFMKSGSWYALPELLSTLKPGIDSSNTGQDSGETELVDQISYELPCNAKSIGSNLLTERNDSKGSSEKLSDFLSERFLSATRPKQVSRGRMLKESFKKNQSQFMKQLSKGCARKLGSETMCEMLAKMGQEMGEKEYNVRIQLCVKHAKRSNDVEHALERIRKAIELLKEMRQLGYAIHEGTYGSFFRYLIDKEMVEEFQYFKDFIREACPESIGKLVYYEILFSIQLNDEAKIHELCYTIDDSGTSLSVLQEYYLVALCEKDRKESLQKVLETVDITNFSSPNVLKSIFEYLGKALLESVAMKLLWELRDCGKDGVEKGSNLIFSYATCIPNSTAEDAILKFNKLHEELDILPSSTSSEKLVDYLCGSKEVATALDVVENMCEAGLVISANILHSLLGAVEHILEFNLVRRILSIMSNKSVKPDIDIFQRLISLCTRIKDFKGAYNMLAILKSFNLVPTSTMYNSILAGYFREVKVRKATKASRLGVRREASPSSLCLASRYLKHMVLKEMKEADVKPDPTTFSYLINYSDQEEAIAEYYEEMKQAGLQANKQVYMSLIKAYASCKQFEKANQVIMYPEVLLKDRNELKSVLISALASNGKIADALSLYEEMKEAGCTVDPKAIHSLIDHSDSNEELTTLVQLAHGLHDYKYWVEAFFKILVFAVRNNKSSSILDLLKQTKNHLSKDDIVVEYWFDEVFKSIAETIPSDVKLGLDLVSFMKEELGLCPSRKCLDFLLQACVNAKDKQSALVVWREYQSAKLPYNVLNYLRMYQVLLAAGDSKGAKAIKSKIHSDDKDVKCIIKESRLVFTPKPKKKTAKKKRFYH